MPGETAKEWELIPPTPPYRDQPDLSPAANFAIGRAHGECHRKRRYTNRQLATSHARILREAQGVDVQVYECSCGGYHVGSPSKHKNKMGRHEPAG